MEGKSPRSRAFLQEKRGLLTGISACNRTSEDRAMITIKVNGREWDILAGRDMPLLWVLRDLLGLTGTKFGCRYIAKILDQAVCSAVIKGSSTITLEDLAVAHGKCLDPEDFVIRGCSPFDEARFKPKMDDVFMGRLKRIGVRPEDAPNASMGRRRKIEPTLQVGV
jgi:hypothetical protein